MGDIQYTSKEKNYITFNFRGLQCEKSSDTYFGHVFKDFKGFGERFEKCFEDYNLIKGIEPLIAQEKISYSKQKRKLVEYVFTELTFLLEEMKITKIREKEKSYVKEKLKHLESEEFFGDPFNEVRDTFTSGTLLERVNTVFGCHEHWIGIRPETTIGRDHKVNEANVAIRSLISGLKTINLVYEWFKKTSL